MRLGMMPTVSVLVSLTFILSTQSLTQLSVEFLRLAHLLAMKGVRKIQRSHEYRQCSLLLLMLVLQMLVQYTVNST